MLFKRVFESLICEVDTALRTLFVPQKRACQRTSPGDLYLPHALNADEKRHVAGLMRVNHAGEVCAQALYQGQGLTAKLGTVKEQMDKAATEEIDHLAWCELRLQELESQTSIFNPIWYSGSFLLGALAGLAGDRWSLGFVAETERQVAAHLQKHLQTIPLQDEKTKAILQQMEIDESHHAQEALAAGAADLPYVIQRLMGTVSKLMTKSSYYL